MLLAKLLYRLCSRNLVRTVFSENEQHRNFDTPPSGIPQGSDAPTPHQKDTVLDVLSAEMHHKKAPTRVIVSASRDGSIRVMK